MARELIQTELHVNELRAIVEESVKKALQNLAVYKTDSIQNENLFSREQIAKELQISLVTLNTWTKNGLPFIKMNGRVFFDKSAVLSFLKDKQESIKK
ncbi:MAG: hypothetical protein K2Q22_09775 [Cytophagales bacterium]|nr:hypothetical protein [Cytophagales bacterium]